MSTEIVPELPDGLWDLLNAANSSYHNLLQAPADSDLHKLRSTYQMWLNAAGDAVTAYFDVATVAPAASESADQASPERNAEIESPEQWANYWLHQIPAGHQQFQGKFAEQQSYKIWSPDSPEYEAVETIVGDNQFLDLVTIAGAAKFLGGHARNRREADLLIIQRSEIWEDMATVQYCMHNRVPDSSSRESELLFKFTIPYDLMPVFCSELRKDPVNRMRALFRNSDVGAECHDQPDKINPAETDKVLIVVGGERVFETYTRGGTSVVSMTLEPYLRAAFARKEYGRYYLPDPSAGIGQFGYPAQVPEVNHGFGFLQIELVG